MWMIPEYLCTTTEMNDAQCTIASEVNDGDQCATPEVDDDALRCAAEIGDSRYANEIDK